MRVLEYCTSRSLGGLELYFLSCYQHLPEKSIDIRAYIQPDSPIQQYMDKKGWRFIPKKEGSFIAQLIRLRRVFQEFNPDIVHTHVKSDLLMVGLCKILFGSFKHIHTRQMNMPHKKKDPFHRFLYNQVDLIIAITEKLQENIIRNIAIHRSKVKLLYYGVPSPQKADIRKIPGLVDDPQFKVGVVARIDRKKNQHLMIEVASLLKKKKLKISVYFIGKTSDELYEQELKKSCTEKDLNQEVKFCGFINQPSNLMTYFDAIVLTTADETFGLVLIEGMRAGVAVIGAAGGGVPEIIDHEKTGLLFRPGDSDDLAQQIEKLITSPETRKKIALQGKKKADHQFNEEGHFKQLIELFELATN